MSVRYHDHPYYDRIRCGTLSILSPFWPLSATAQLSYSGSSCVKGDSGDSSLLQT